MSLRTKWKGRVRYTLILPCFIVHVLYGQLVSWQPTSGPGGGDVRAFAVGLSGEIFAGLGNGGGVYRSVDNGSSWVRCEGGLVGMSIMSLFMSGGQLYAGTFGNGIYRSPDHGKSWVKIDLGYSDIYGSSFARYTDGAGHEYIFAATGGYGYISNWSNVVSHGVFRSSDHGVTWKWVGTGLNSTSIDCLLVTSAGVLAGDGLHGVYRSTDGGSSWTEVWATTSPALSLCETRSNVILAGLAYYGIYRSTDYGLTWASANSGLTQSKIWSLAVLPDGRTIAGTESGGLFCSTDAGLSWSAINNGLPPADVRVIALSTDNRILLGLDTFGVLRTDPGGSSFVSANDGMNASTVYDLKSDAEKNLIAASGSGVFRSSDHGFNWERLNWLSPNPSSFNQIAVAPGKKMYLASGNLFESSDDGYTWSLVNDALVWIFGAGASTVVCPDSTHVYFGGGWVFGYSTDAGTTWTNVHRNDYIYVLSSTNSGALLAGVWRSVRLETYHFLYRSSDGGNSWQNSGGGPAGPYGKDYDSFIATGGSNMLASSQYGIEQSSDDGLTWTLITNDMSATGGAHYLTMDSRGRLFAVTNQNGISVSTDKGHTWSDFETGLQGIGIRCVTAVDDSIYVGTIGNGVYHLAIVDTSPDDIPLPDRFSLSQNYPNPFNPGTTIEYSLPQPSYVTLTLYNILGQRIRTLVDEAKPAGTYTVRLDGAGLASGVYFYRMRAGNFTATKKLVLLR